MEKVIRNVAEIDDADRRAIEHVLGRHLDKNQQLIISVVNLDLAESGEPAPFSSSTGIPAWWNVYEGLSDEEVDQLDESVRRRADLSRDIS